MIIIKNRIQISGSKNRTFPSSGSWLTRPFYRNPRLFIKSQYSDSFNFDTLYGNILLNYKIK
jgi:hypothetical protein